jgi:outer membrane protein TolC
MTHHNLAWCRSAALFLATLFVSLGAWAQDAADQTPQGIQSPLPVTALPSVLHKVDLSFKTGPTERVSFSARGIALAATVLAPGSDGVCRLTLDEAKQAAAAASSPLVRVGELQVEAAKQHRLGVQANYFPNISTSFVDLHFNKHPGDVLTLQGPLGNQHQVPVNIINKDQNAVNVMAVQPITPLFAIYQLVKIARADENIARAKAGMPVTEAASKVEKDFFDLLVAQRELTSSKTDARKIQAKWMTASNSGTLSVSTEQETDMINAEKAVVGPASKVKELTASLNEMLGLPEGTKLELVPPEPFVEHISLAEATDKAMVANPEVVEAQQTSIKAHAAEKISKMEYAPTVGVLGGYAFQNSLNLVLPRSFGYIGASASWTIFNFGKREHGVKESKANAEAADLGVELVKAKVAAAVKNSYFEMDRSRQLYQLARRMVSATQVVEASYKPDDPEVESARAKMEADMFRAEFEYRQAYAKLKALMGAQ